MAEEATCKTCGNHVCEDFKEEEETQSKKLASLLDPMRTRIYQREEVCPCVRVCVHTFVCVACARACVCVTCKHMSD